MSEEIIRRPDRAEGPITEEERKALEENARLWISRAIRTTPVDRAEIDHAIRGLYKVVDLDEPNIVHVVSSPLTMVFAYGCAYTLCEGNSGSNKVTKRLVEIQKRREGMVHDKIAGKINALFAGVTDPEVLKAKMDLIAKAQQAASEIVRSRAS